MVKTYICSQCGYTFPQELTNLIDNRIQVYCERCGSPFNLEGVKFKTASTPQVRKSSRIFTISEKDSSNLDKLIQFLNKISFIPLFIFTIVLFGLFTAEIIHNLHIWSFIIFDRFLPGLIGLLLLIYERGYLAPKIKEKKYNEIFLDSFCWGILSCVLYGIGIFILFRGIFIIISVIVREENKNLKPYEYGLLAKNSLNNLSSKAGFVIILMGIFTLFAQRIYIPGGDFITISFPFYLEIPRILLVYFILFIISSVALIIDKRSRSIIEIKQTFEIGDSVKILITGILGVLFFAAGIFILLKGVLVFFLFATKSSEKPQITLTERKVDETLRVEKGFKSQLPPDIDEEKSSLLTPVKEPLQIDIAADEKEAIKTEIKVEQQVEKIEYVEVITEKEKKEDEYELKLHDSLLPVKDENDKKLVKEYFSKIFMVLSKDLREQIKNLKISKKEKKKLLEELAFLSKEEQVRYIEAIVDLYQEIPKKLIERIRNLPNINPKHMDKIVQQLKIMDVEEQLRFVQFLEENA